MRLLHWALVLGLRALSFQGSKLPEYQPIVAPLNNLHYSSLTRRERLMLQKSFGI